MGATLHRYSADREIFFFQKIFNEGRKKQRLSCTFFFEWIKTTLLNQSAAAPGGL